MVLESYAKLAGMQTPVWFRAILTTIMVIAMSGWSSSPSDAQPVKRLDKQHVGAQVVIEGRVSKTPYQHLIDPVAGKNIEYFDLDDGDQIVIYVKGPIGCAGKVRLTGKVKEVVGTSKRPGSKHKERYVEYQIDVTRWQCLEGPRRKG